MKRFWLKILLVFLAIGAVDKVIMPLYTSRGKETSVPDVTRMTYQEASRVLSKSRLEAKKSYNVKYLNNVSPDVVPWSSRTETSIWFSTNVNGQAFPCRISTVELKGRFARALPGLT